MRLFPAILVVGIAIVCLAFYAGLKKGTAYMRNSESAAEVDPDQLLQEAEKLKEDGDFLGAYFAYKKLLKHAPQYWQDMKILQDLAECLFEAGEYKRAATIYKKIADTTSDNSVKAGALFRIGDCLLKEGKTLKAVEHFEKVCEEFPEYPRVPKILLHIAWIYEQMGEYDKAREQYRAIIAKYPKWSGNVDVLYRWGQLELNIRSYENAARVLKQLVVFFPEYEHINKACLMLADALYQQGEYLDAARLYESLGEEEAYRVEGYTKAGLCYMKLEDYKNAAECFKKAREKYESYLKEEKGNYENLILQADYGLADALYQLGQYEEAQSVYEETCQAFPDDWRCGWAELRIGDCLLHRGLLSEAKKKYSKVAEQYPDSLWAKHAQWMLEDMKWRDEFGVAAKEKGLAMGKGGL